MLFCDPAFIVSVLHLLCLAGSRKPEATQSKLAILALHTLVTRKEGSGHPLILYPFNPFSADEPEIVLKVEEVYKVKQVQKVQPVQRAHPC